MFDLLDGFSGPELIGLITFVSLCVYIGLLISMRGKW